MRRAKSATVDLKARMKEPLRAKLEVAAKTRGVSLNFEMVSRLESSFAKESAQDDALGGAETHAVLRMFGAAAHLIDIRTGKSWLSDWETALAVKAAWKMLALTVAPSPPDEFREMGDAPLPELPPMPARPELPSLGVSYPRGLLGPEDNDVRKSYEAACAKYEEEWAKYDKEAAVYKDALQERSRQLREIVRHMESLADLGKDIAGSLLPSTNDAKE